MVQRRQGRRKSIMIVEKDRTAQEIDKRPHEEKQNMKSKENLEKKKEEDTVDQRKEEMIDDQNKQTSQIQSADKTKEMEKEEQKMVKNMSEHQETTNKDENEGYIHKEGVVEETQGKEEQQSVIRSKVNEEQPPHKQEEEEQPLHKQEEVEQPLHKQEEEREKEDQPHEEVKETKVNQEKHPHEEQKHPDQQSPHKQDEVKGEEEKDHVHFDEKENKTTTVEKDPSKSLPSPDINEIENKKAKADKEIQQMEDNVLMGGVSAQAASETKLSKQKEEMRQHERENEQKEQHDQKMEDAHDKMAQHDQMVHPHEQKIEDVHDEQMVQKREDHANMSKSQLDGLTGAVPASELHPDSELSNIKPHLLIEGNVRKRMFICPCFYHTRYFCLTKDGVLMYFSNKNGRARNRININEEIQLIRRVNESDEIFKIIMKFKDGSVESLRYDTEEIRDVWHQKMNQFLDEPGQSVE